MSANFLPSSTAAAISGEAIARCIISALSNHNSPIPSAAVSFGRSIAWFCIHLLRPGIFLTIEVCLSPLHSAKARSWVRSALLNQTNMSFIAGLRLKKALDKHGLDVIDRKVIVEEP